MADHKPGLAVLAAALLLALVPYGAARAAMPSLAFSQPARAAIVKVAQEGPRFHHGKRVQSAYCLRRNYWWFYRPYTTAQEDFPRCEPYFHYLEPANGRRGAQAEPYFK
jgi:hypothetical protein